MPKLSGKGWINKFTREFLEKSGEHLIEVGITGSGKTQGLYWILDGLLKHHPGETVIWFDTGKTSEILSLLKFSKLNIIIPPGCEISINAEISNYQVINFRDPVDIWTKCIIHDRVNVVCLEPFILNPVVYTKVFSELFFYLIRLAHNYELKLPMALFVDEFHRITPSKGNALDYRQMTLGAIIQHNIETLRSLKIRFVCTSHGWQKIRSGVRNSFSWILARRGGHFASDQPKLNRFNPLFEKLQTDEGIITFPTKIFTDIIHFPYYEKGEALGTVRYHGIYEGEKDKEKPKRKRKKLTQKDKRKR